MKPLPTDASPRSSSSGGARGRFKGVPGKAPRNAEPMRTADNSDERAAVDGAASIRSGHGIASKVRLFLFGDTDEAPRRRGEPLPADGARPEAAAGAPPAPARPFQISATLAAVLVVVVSIIVVALCAVAVPIALSIDRIKLVAAGSARASFAHCNDRVVSLLAQPRDAGQSLQQLVTMSDLPKPPHFDAWDNTTQWYKPWLAAHLLYATHSNFTLYQEGTVFLDGQYVGCQNDVAPGSDTIWCIYNHAGVEGIDPLTPGPPYARTLYSMSNGTVTGFDTGDMVYDGRTRPWYLAGAARLEREAAERAAGLREPHMKIINGRAIVRYEGFWADITFAGGPLVPMYNYIMPMYCISGEHIGISSFQLELSRIDTVFKELLAGLEQKVFLLDNRRLLIAASEHKSIIVREPVPHDYVLTATDKLRNCARDVRRDTIVCQHSTSSYGYAPLDELRRRWTDVLGPSVLPESYFSPPTTVPTTTTTTAVPTTTTTNAAVPEGDDPAPPPHDPLPEIPIHPGPSSPLYNFMAVEGHRSGTVDLDGSGYYALVAPLQEGLLGPSLLESGMDWRLVVLIRDSDVTSQLYTALYISIGIVCAIVVVTVVLVGCGMRLLLQPLADVAKQMRASTFLSSSDMSGSSSSGADEEEADGDAEGAGSPSREERREAKRKARTDSQLRVPSHLAEVASIQQSYWAMVDELRLLRGYIPEHVRREVLGAKRLAGAGGAGVGIASSNPAHKIPVSARSGGGRGKVSGGEKDKQRNGNSNSSYYPLGGGQPKSRGHSSTSNSKESNTANNKGGASGTDELTAVGGGDAIVLGVEANVADKAAAAAAGAAAVVGSGDALTSRRLQKVPFAPLTTDAAAEWVAINAGAQPITSTGSLNASMNGSADGTNGNNREGGGGGALGASGDTARITISHAINVNTNANAAGPAKHHHDASSPLVMETASTAAEFLSHRAVSLAGNSDWVAGGLRRQEASGMGMGLLAGLGGGGLAGGGGDGGGLYDADPSPIFFGDSVLVDRDVSVAVVNIVQFHRYVLRHHGTEITREHAEVVRLVHATARRCGGVLETFMGDRFIVSFNATSKCTHHAVAATCFALEVSSVVNKAAVAGLQRMQQKQQQKSSGGGGGAGPYSPANNDEATGGKKAGKKGGPLKLYNAAPCGVTCGVATGRAFVGPLGIDAILRHTIISNAIPEASALERMAIRYPNCSVVVGGDMIPAIEGYCQYLLLDATLLPGSGGKRRRIASVKAGMCREGCAPEALRGLGDLAAARARRVTPYSIINASFNAFLEGRAEDCRSALATTSQMIADKRGGVTTNPVVDPTAAPPKQQQSEQQAGQHSPNPNPIAPTNPSHVIHFTEEQCIDISMMCELIASFVDSPPGGAPSDGRTYRSHMGDLYAPTNERILLDFPNE